jgi:hypothetical protein
MPLNLTAINVGSAPGDKTGDQGRTAFQTVNTNMALIAGFAADAEIKSFGISVTDEQQTIDERITVLGTTDGILRTIRMPFSFVLLEVRASYNVADSSGDLQLDILENGVSVFASGSALTLGVGSKTSVGYSPAPEFAATNIILNDDSEIKIQLLTQPSGGADGKGLNVTLIGYVIWTSF